MGVTTDNTAIKFIDMEDNRPASEAESLDLINFHGMPAGTARESFFRIGNASERTLTNLPITVTGNHSDRISLSFKEFGTHSESLLLESLESNRSQNLYIKLLLPDTVADESVKNIIYVGENTLVNPAASFAITYESSRAITTLFDPYPIWEGGTELGVFTDTPVHRFFRWDPIENPNGTTPQATTSGKFILKDQSVCEYLNANNRRVGYEEPIYGDFRCIPTPKEVESPFEFEPLSPDDYSYEDRANVYLLPSFLSDLGNAPPIWTHFHTENNPAPQGLAKLTTPIGLGRFKKTVFCMEREGSLYELSHLYPVTKGQYLAYYKAQLRLIQEPSAGNPKGWNPFAFVYDEDSQRVITRYGCWNSPSLKELGGSDTGTGSNLGS